VNAECGQSVLVYDIGGSHVSASLCTTDRLALSEVQRATLADDVSPEAFVDLLTELGRKAVNGGPVPAGASVAIPGPFEFDVGISRMHHKLPKLFGYDLRTALAKRLGCDPAAVRFLGDAASFLVGELAAGAAAGAARAVGITLGTGIGSAFARDGRWVTSGEAVPPGGEIWNLPYADGTVEDLLSTRALRKDYETRTGRNPEVAEIAAAAASDPDARAVFETFGEHLGQVFRVILGPFAPDVIVIGGGISRSSRLFFPAAERQLAGLPGFRLVPSSLLEHATLLGAAAHWRS